MPDQGESLEHDMSQDALEGRLLAHRRMLQLIIGALAGTAAGDRVGALLRERSTLQDGQEDPGAVETSGLGVELAVAEEFRRVVDGLPDITAGDASSGPPRGPGSDAGPSVPARDPPAR